MIGYLDKAIRPLILIMPKMNGYFKTFKVKDGDKDKNNKLMSSHIRTYRDKVYTNFCGLNVPEDI